MVQRRCCPGFTTKALKRLGIPRQVLRQELERHEPTEPRILGLVHHTHPAAAELFDDLVVGDFPADHEWRRNLVADMLRVRTEEVNEYSNCAAQAQRPLFSRF